MDISRIYRRSGKCIPLPRARNRGFVGDVALPLLCILVLPVYVSGFGGIWLGGIDIGGEDWKCRDMVLVWF
jgi:hypothetical protein